MTDRPVRRGRWGELIPEPKEPDAPSSRHAPQAVPLDDDPSVPVPAASSVHSPLDSSASESPTRHPVPLVASADRRRGLGSAESEKAGETDGETMPLRGRHRKAAAARPDSHEAESPEETFKRGLRAASDMLSRAEYPPGALRRKLREKGFEGAIIEDILDRLGGAGLLNEEKMAIRRAEFLHRVKHYGPLRIERELIRLGFSEAVARQVDLDGEDFDFAQSALRILQKSGYEEAAPAIRRLCSYGYSLSMAKQAWKRYMALQEET